MGDFEITVPGGPMVCGYCGETETWHQYPQSASLLALGYLKLTGFHAIGVGPVGELVVLAEAERLNGQVEHYPHLCESIPRAVRDKYAAEIQEILSRREAA